MIFIHDIYKFIPTYRLTLPGYPTREIIHQIGVALAEFIAMRMSMYQRINNEDIIFTYRANNTIRLYDPGTEVGGHPTLLALNNTH